MADSKRQVPTPKAKPGAKTARAGKAASDQGGNRRNRGQFVPGASGNPGGRPQMPPELKEAAQALSIEALEILARLMKNPKTPAAARVRAAEVIINRGYGTPVQAVELAGKNGGPIQCMTYEQALTRLQELKEQDGAQ